MPCLDLRVSEPNVIYFPIVNVPAEIIEQELAQRHYLSLVMKVTPSTVRHLNAFPWRMPYCEALRLVRFASPLLAAGIVPTSPTSSVPIG